jgi:hypothetical protein
MNQVNEEPMQYKRHRGNVVQMMNETERRKFLKMMQQIHSDKELRLRVVADVRKLAADPVWCAKRATELRRQAES